MSSFVSRHIGFILFKIAIFMLLDLFYYVAMNALEKPLAFTAYSVKNGC